VREAWGKAKQKVAVLQKVKELEGRYGVDPVGFGEQVLGDRFTEDVKRVMESVRDHPITLARSANSTGKTHSAARVAAWFYKCHPDSQVYLITAGAYENLKRQLWGEVMGVVGQHPGLFEEDNILAGTVMRSAQSFIATIAIPAQGTEEEREAKVSGKHAPWLLFIVDEGDAVGFEIYRGIEGCMSNDNARLLVLYNPKSQSGPVYDMEVEKRAHVVHLSAFNHPNVVEGREVIPGAVTREKTVRRINEWTVWVGEDEKVAEGRQDVYRLPDFLVGAVAKATSGEEYPPLAAGYYRILQPLFSYMVQGFYPAQAETQLINTDWIDAARARYDEYVRRWGGPATFDILPILGLDVAEMGVDANVACLRYNDFVPPMLTWNGVDPDLTATRGLDIYKEKSCKIAFVDATGVGSSVAPSMARQGRDAGVRAYSLKVAAGPTPGSETEFGAFYQLRDQLWWAAREWLRTNPNAMLPPDPFLTAELRAPTYKVQGGKIMVMPKDQIRSKIRRSPDRADALCLTFMPIYKAKLVRLGLPAPGGEVQHA